MFTGVGGIGVGFYFSWKLSLVILAGVLAFATLYAHQGDHQAAPGQPRVREGGRHRHREPHRIRVTSALNAQGRVAARYESNLGDAERVATKNQWNISFAWGLFGSMFIMYAAFGLWFGAYPYRHLHG